MCWSDTDAVKLLEECVRIEQERAIAEEGREVTTNGKDHDAIARRLFACEQADALTNSVRAQFELYGHSAELDVLEAWEYG